jgi:prepilin signal peptidase PulO-like enzyme (type II secretory pathway)
VSAALPLCTLAIAALLLMLAVIDLRHRRLPHPLTAALAVLGLAHGMLAGGTLAPPWGALGAGLLVASPFWLLRRLAPAPGRVGGGDVRLAFAIGCLLGPGGGLLAAMLATGGLALGGAAARLSGRGTVALPLGPFLAGAVLLLLA